MDSNLLPDDRELSRLVLAPDTDAHRSAGFTANLLGGLLRGDTNCIRAVDFDYLVLRSHAYSLSRSTLDGASDDKTLLFLLEVDADADDACVDGVVLILESTGVQKTGVWIVQRLQHRLDETKCISVGVDLTVVLVLEVAPILARHIRVVVIVFDELPGAVVDLYRLRPVTRCGLVQHRYNEKCRQKQSANALNVFHREPHQA